MFSFPLADNWHQRFTQRACSNPACRREGGLCVYTLRWNSSLSVGSLFTLLTGSASVRGGVAFQEDPGNLHLPNHSVRTSATMAASTPLLGRGGEQPALEAP